MQTVAIPSSLNISNLTVKVLRTGQDITLKDSRYVKIYKLDDTSYLLVYTAYFTGTMLTLRCEEKDGTIVITVEDYQNPSLPTSCNVYLNGEKILDNINELSIGAIYKPGIKPAKAYEWPQRLGPLKKVVHVDTFGVQCGIATYLEGIMNHLIPLDKTLEQIVFAEDIPAGDERASTGKGYSGHLPTLYRNWMRRQSLERITKDFLEVNPDILHIQHEWAFFPASETNMIHLLELSKNRGSANMVTWHTVYEREEYNPGAFFQHVNFLIDAHIVHDVNSLKNLLSYRTPPEKVHHIPMSAYPVKDTSKDEARRKMLPEKYWGKKLLITGGFLLPNKGVEKILLAMSLMKDPELALICIGGSHPWSVKVYKDYHDLVVSTAKQTGMDLYLDYRFMDDDEIANYMACADIVVLYYGWTLSGTSGWSRRAIASRRPIIATDVRLMSDLQDGIHCLKVPPRDIGALAKAISKLLGDPLLENTLADNAAKYALEISPENTARRHLELYRQVYETCKKQT